MTRIGVSPLLWANDDMPELGGDTPVETILDGARDAGYEGVELGHAFPREPEALRALLEPRGLTLASGWYGSRLLERSVAEELEAMQPHCGLLHELGASVMVLAEVSGSVYGDRAASLATRPVLDEPTFERLASAVTELGKALAEQGIRVAYHHHLGTVVQTEDEVDRLMALTAEASDAVGLLLDTGHMTFAGGDAAAVALRHGRRIVHVHAKDVDPVTAERALSGGTSFLDSVLDGAFRIPGDGVVDFPAVLAALNTHHYDGWLIVEADQDVRRYQPAEHARRAFAYITRVAAHAGLRAA